jgi:hypothetical protein
VGATANNRGDQYQERDHTTDRWDMSFRKPPMAIPSVTRDRHLVDVGR